MCVSPWSLDGWQVWGGLLLCLKQSISPARHSFSENMVKSGRKTRAAMNLILKGLSPLPWQHLRGACAILRPHQNTFISLPFSYCRLMNYMGWGPRKVYLYLACHSHHFSGKSITYQEENAPKSLTIHTVQCLYTRRVYDEHEGKYWLMLSLNTDDLFYEASNSILKHGPAHAHTLNLGV